MNAAESGSDGGSRRLAAASVFELLGAPTPVQWLDAALRSRDELLIDHANCEKKAASSALSLIFTYAEDATLTERLSRLAREELRHFEQVQRLMIALGVPFRRLKPGRYADRLRREVRLEEPGRRLDLLVCGALIEARSCERFIALAPRLDEPLGAFYHGLGEAEARHFRVYLELAEQSAGDAGRAELNARLEQFAELEAQLITSPDTQFRFHSGVTS